MPTFVSEMAGVSASGPMWTLACDQGSCVVCARAGGATMDSIAIRKNLCLTRRAARNATRNDGRWPSEKVKGGTELWTGHQPGPEQCAGYRPARDLLARRARSRPSD